MVHDTWQTKARLVTLREVYEHQAGLIGGLSKDVARLRTGQEDAEERLEEICKVAEEQRVRAFCVLFYFVPGVYILSMCVFFGDYLLHFCDICLVKSLAL